MYVITVSNISMKKTCITMNKKIKSRVAQVVKAGSLEVAVVMLVQCTLYCLYLICNYCDY